MSKEKKATATNEDANRVKLYHFIVAYHVLSEQDQSNNRDATMQVIAKDLAAFLMTTL